MLTIIAQWKQGHEDGGVQASLSYIVSPCLKYIHMYVYYIYIYIHT